LCIVGKWGKYIRLSFTQKVLANPFMRNFTF
jgi:hypothetical protein